jgi:hypothetical protein
VSSGYRACQHACIIRSCLRYGWDEATRSCGLLRLLSLIKLRMHANLKEDRIQQTIYKIFISTQGHTHTHTAWTVVCTVGLTSTQRFSTRRDSSRYWSTCYGQQDKKQEINIEEEEEKNLCIQHAWAKLQLLVVATTHQQQSPFSHTNHASPACTLFVLLLLD